MNSLRWEWQDEGSSTKNGSRWDWQDGGRSLMFTLSYDQLVLVWVWLEETSP